GDGRVGVDTDEQGPLEPLGTRREAGDLVLDELIEPALGERERATQQLLARREVVVDERFRDARLLGHTGHPQTVCTFTNDDAAGRLEDRDDAVGLRWGRGAHWAILTQMGVSSILTDRTVRMQIPQ